MGKFRNIWRKRSARGTDSTAKIIDGDDVDDNDESDRDDYDSVGKPSNQRRRSSSEKLRSRWEDMTNSVTRSSRSACSSKAGGESCKSIPAISEGNDCDDDDDDEEEEEEKEKEETKTSQSVVASSTSAPGSAPIKTKRKNPFSRLAVKGKAPIHLSIESFGFAHGAPPRKARNRSGSPYTQPMGLLSVGDDITDPVPTHLEFHDGLRSGVIKRMLKAAPLVDSSGKDDIWTATDQDETDTEPDLSDYKDFSAYCRKYLAESRIFPALREAIDEGGHGYVSPLTMTFQIGSHLGRHRSVVAVEWVAQHLRSLLRANDGGKIPCSVSVGTVHRDVSKRIPQKTYREDEDEDDKADRV
mmetsp:Transcript_13710/g.31994  ORF Transcript_13710/g.31994 Transcript_13710/m.31994 type:complete len:356 (-) Transcript_13710:240-1307(-)